MKTILFIISASLLLLAGCSAAPGEQIVTITAGNTPAPAVTPVSTAVPSPSPGEEASPAPSAVPAPAAEASPVPQLTAAPTPEPAPEATEAPAPEPAEDGGSSDFGGDVLSLVNSYRSSSGLSSLKYSSAMQKAADTRAKECASSFSHTRPDGSSAYTALTERGISFTAFGENIFAASGMDSVSAEYVVEQWMASSGHRENILRDGFTHMCIGAAAKGDEIYVVQLFGAGIS